MTTDHENTSISVNRDSRPAFSTPPHFDHVFVTVSVETQKLINECDFLVKEQFGRFSLRVSESSMLGSYMPTRVYGKNNLIEIFPNKFGGNEKFVEHCAGIILSFDHPGEMAQARNELQLAGLKFSGEVVDRIMPNGSGGRDRTPWYDFTRPDMGSASPIAVFLHEIQPGFLAQVGANVGPGGRVDRGARFDASLGRPHTSNQVMENILGVTVRLRRDRIERASAILTTLGCEVTAVESGISVRGIDGEIIFVADDSPREGTMELKFAITRPDPGRRFDFGTESSLVLSPAGPEDYSAVWSFRPHRNSVKLP